MFKTKIHNLTVLNEMERMDTLIKLNAYIGIQIRNVQSFNLKYRNFILLGKRTNYGRTELFMRIYIKQLLWERIRSNLFNYPSR